MKPGTKCGPNICKPGETCCNASCGYCTKPGVGCTKEFCGKAPPLVAEPAPEPAKDEGDDDAVGAVEEEPVAPQENNDKPSLWGVKCGTNTCAKGFVCCNASCGVCTPPGWMCTQEVCDPVEAPPPSLPQCGKTFCKAGQVSFSHLQLHLCRVIYG